MRVPSAVRRVYDGVALFALLNVAVVGGMTVYLVGSGALDARKIQRIASVMRGEERPVQGEAETAPVEAGAEASSTEAAPAAVIDTQLELEIVRREAERTREELRQRLALSNSILLRITAERENFRREREAAAQMARAQRRELETEGFEKQIAILGGVKAKTAVEHLLSLGDPDEAARILLAMDTRKAKKIVEAAKRPDQMEQMKSILRCLRDVAPDRATDLVPGL